MYSTVLRGGQATTIHSKDNTCRKKSEKEGVQGKTGLALVALQCQTSPNGKDFARSRHGISLGHAGGGFCRRPCTPY